ncbi:BREX system ATP-binding protein BrxD [Tsukamurella soli]|uniref:BREX system ATP-binding protein BrxD n=1 Tax=Tsukamurella soli TaxID=644556 RepID=A0ABP8J2B8_9ACTN
MLDALRRGSVPEAGLGQLAVGLTPFAATLGAELDVVKGGSGVFKVARGEYGSGKTFFARWLAERSLRAGFAASELQVNEIETPLYRLDAVYRQCISGIRTSSVPRGGFRQLIDAWLYTIESDAYEQGRAFDDVLDRRLAVVAATAPVFPQVIRAYRKASESGDRDVADGLISWLGGQPNISAAIKRAAGVKGDLDNRMALEFLRGVVTIMRDSGHAGLFLVIDEVETVQRMRRDSREKSLNVLRQLVDQISDGSFSGLYLMVTGTPAFLEGQMGIASLPPLAQRLHTEFGSNPKFDNPRAPQIRLTGFDAAKLLELGGRVRDLYVAGADNADRVGARVDDAFLEVFGRAVAGQLGERVGLAPRLYIRKLVDVMDKIDIHAEFDPYADYELELSLDELTPQERAIVTGTEARATLTADDIAL